jgi:hypothetical protein
MIQKRKFVSLFLQSRAIESFINIISAMKYNKKSFKNAKMTHCHVGRSENRFFKHLRLTHRKINQIK